MTASINISNFKNTIKCSYFVQLNDVNHTSLIKERLEQSYF